jgi:hypothetical protein
MEESSSTFNESAQLQSVMNEVLIEINYSSASVSGIASDSKDQPSSGLIRQAGKSPREKGSTYDLTLYLCF